MIINEMPGLALGSTSASASTIMNGYTAYDGNGNLITGSALSTATNLEATYMMEGASGYDGNGNYIVGVTPNKGGSTVNVPYGSTIDIPWGVYWQAKATAGTFSFSGNAASGQVLSGYTFYGSNGTRQTGSIATYDGSVVSS